MQAAAYLDDGSMLWEKHGEGHGSPMYQDVDVCMSYSLSLLLQRFACNITTALRACLLKAVTAVCSMM